ncbi:hypothetical protein [Actinokineospora sp.]|uniref:hypothetical protein n=1 Tax=Actinokineospora sp. TaxID=1872133 RepID=UPI0040378202
MSGHLEEAAGILNAASQQTPVEHIRAAGDALSTVAQYIQQVGGPIGQELTAETLAIQADVHTLGGRLDALRHRLDTSAQHVLRGSV